MSGRRCYNHRPVDALGEAEMSVQYDDDLPVVDGLQGFQAEAAQAGTEDMKRRANAEINTVLTIFSIKGFTTDLAV